MRPYQQRMDLHDGVFGSEFVSWFEKSSAACELMHLHSRQYRVCDPGSESQGYNEKRHGNSAPTLVDTLNTQHIAG